MTRTITIEIDDEDFAGLQELRETYFFFDDASTPLDQIILCCVSYVIQDAQEMRASDGHQSHVAPIIEENNSGREGGS